MTICSYSEILVVSVSALQARQRCSASFEGLPKRRANVFRYMNARIKSRPLLRFLNRNNYYRSCGMLWQNSEIASNRSTLVNGYPRSARLQKTSHTTFASSSVSARRVWVLATMGALTFFMRRWNVDLGRRAIKAASRTASLWQQQ